MARKKQNEDATKLILAVLGVVLFLPFMFFSFMHYNKIKKYHIQVDNVQRVFDIGLLWRSIAFSTGIVSAGIAIMFYFNQIVIGSIPPEYINFLLAFDGVCLIMAFYPIKKMAERVAVRYAGVIFDDNQKVMLIPADLENSSFGDNIRLQFIKRMGDYDKITINDIANVTREKGVNFFIHGNFGSRKINFSNKQKRDECLVALQSRFSIRIGRDLGY